MMIPFPPLNSEPELQGLYSFTPCSAQLRGHTRGRSRAGGSYAAGEPQYTASALPAAPSPRLSASDPSARRNNKGRGGQQRREVEQRQTACDATQVNILRWLLERPPTERNG